MMTDKFNCSKLQVIFEKEKSERKRKWNLDIFTLFDVKMIQIWTFPADPSTERVPSLAERVAYLRHLINLRLFNWRVPALMKTYPKALICWIGLLERLALQNRKKVNDRWFGEKAQLRLF